jgi:hypothetical protein
MKLISNSLEEYGDGNLIFELEGYIYQIGQLDGPPCWFSRQTIYDYENGLDNWETPTGWGPENLIAFKFFKHESF